VHSERKCSMTCSDPVVVAVNGKWEQATQLLTQSQQPWSSHGQNNGATLGLLSGNVFTVHLFKFIIC